MNPFVNLDNVNLIEEIDQVEYGLDIVVSIWASVNDVQPEIDFCVCPEFHRAHKMLPIKYGNNEGEARMANGCVSLIVVPFFCKFIFTQLNGTVVERRDSER